MIEWTEDIDDLIGLVLTGEASAAQQEAVNRWRSLDEENESYFRQMTLVYERAAYALHAWPELDVDAAWNKMEKQLDGGRRVVPLNQNSAFRWWYAAAAIIALMGVAVWLFRSGPQESGSFALHAGETVVADTLPDGSLATLNRNSSLEYSKDKSGKRMAHLKGEGYFQVKHSDEEEFVIDAGEVFIRDVGTVFNVNAPEGSDSVVVFVREGSVDFYTEENSGLRLQAGEEAIYLRSAQRFNKRVPQDENVSSYADRTFNFSNTPMRRVIRRLNEVYQSNIQLDKEALGECRLTVSFENDDLEVVVDIIAETMNWQVMKLPNGYVFIGEECGVE